ARGRQRARPYGEALWLRPDDLADCRIPGNEVTHAAMAVRGGEHGERGADIGLARRVFHLERLIRHADVVGRNEDEARLRIVARGLLVLGSQRCRTDVLHVDIGTRRARRVLLVDERTTGLHVNLRGPVDLRIVLLGNQQLAGRTIHRVAEAVAIEV